MARAERIPINEADQHRLTREAGIDEWRAALLVRWRKEHGPFRTWRDVEEVPGMDAAALARLHDAATLGDTGTDEADDDVGAAPEDEGLGALDAALDDAELDALLAVAQLDLEAAAAYELAADTVDDAGLQALLLRFAEEHRRHVQRIEQLAADRGAPATVLAPDTERSVLLVLLSAVSAVDPTAALDALIANEHLTNATYDTAVGLTADAEALSIVERHLEDERRHLRALEAYVDEHEP